MFITIINMLFLNYLVSFFGKFFIVLNFVFLEKNKKFIDFYILK